MDGAKLDSIVHEGSDSDTDDSSSCTSDSSSTSTTTTTTTSSSSTDDSISNAPNDPQTVPSMAKVAAPPPLVAAASPASPLAIVHAGLGRLPGVASVDLSFLISFTAPYGPVASLCRLAELLCQEADQECSAPITAPAAASSKEAATAAPSLLRDVRAACLLDGDVDGDSDTGSQRRLLADLLAQPSLVALLDSVGAVADGDYDRLLVTGAATALPSAALPLPSPPAAKPTPAPASLLPPSTTTATTVQLRQKRRVSYAGLPSLPPDAAPLLVMASMSAATPTQSSSLSPSPPPSSPSSLSSERQVSIYKSAGESLGLRAVRLLRRSCGGVGDFQHQRPLIAVTEIVPGGKLDRQGILQPGDIIAEVNEEPVESPEALHRLLRQLSGTVTFKLVASDQLVGRRSEPRVLYLRARFNYRPERDPGLATRGGSTPAGLAFACGDVLQVVGQADAAYWQARLVDTASGGGSGGIKSCGLVPSPATALLLHQNEERRRQSAPPDGGHSHQQRRKSFDDWSRVASSFISATLGSGGGTHRRSSVHAGSAAHNAAGAAAPKSASLPRSASAHQFQQQPQPPKSHSLLRHHPQQQQHQRHQLIQQLQQQQQRQQHSSRYYEEVARQPARRVACLALTGPPGSGVSTAAAAGLQRRLCAGWPARFVSAASVGGRLTTPMTTSPTPTAVVLCDCQTVERLRRSRHQPLVAVFVLPPAGPTSSTASSPTSPQTTTVPPCDLTVSASTSQELALRRILAAVQAVEDANRWAPVTATVDEKVRHSAG